MQDEELTPGMSFSPAKSIRKARSPWCSPAPDKKLELRSWELPSSPFLALTTFCSSRLTWDFLPQPCLEEPEACVAKLRIKKQIGTLLTFTTDAVTPPRNELTPYTPLAQLGLEGKGWAPGDQGSWPKLQKSQRMSRVTSDKCHIPHPTSPKTSDQWQPLGHSLSDPKTLLIFYLGTFSLSHFPLSLCLIFQYHQLCISKASSTEGRAWACSTANDFTSSTSSGKKTQTNPNPRSCIIVALLFMDLKCTPSWILMCGPFSSH